MTRLRPLGPAETLRWLRPESRSPDSFEKLRPKLERVARTSQPAHYEAKRRALYRVDDAEAGSVAIKEIRSNNAVRRLWFRFVREHPALNEFRVGSAFEARGGPTAPFLGAVVEHSRFGIARVLLFLRWIEGAVDLAAELERSGRDPDTELLRQVATAVAEHSRLGLFHGRHAPGNLLLVPRGDGIAVEPIDFAYASLGDGFDENAWVADVSRIAHHMAYLELCGSGKVREFLALAAAAAFAGAETDRAHTRLREATDTRLQQSRGRPL